MVKSLTQKERAEAFIASLEPSFSGCAIVNSDFTFRYINSQFCKILGVTPADLIGMRFQDVTHHKSKRKDETNAKLVMQGKIASYIMEKEYEFEGGRRVKVVLLVNRVPMNKEKPFLFFLSRIMPSESLQSDTTYQKRIKTWLNFIINNSKTIIAIGGIIGATIMAFKGAMK